METHTEEELNNGSELDNSNNSSSKPTNAHGPTSFNSSSGLHSPFLDCKSTQNLHSIGLGEIIRPYRCSSCEKSYKDPATLRQHEKTHWLTRPYPCSICGKKFTQRGTMTRHMRSHLGLKPFACDDCGMRFTRQYRLTEHMRIHSGEKPYKCQVCGGKFAQQRNLISHMKMHSSGTAGGGLTPDGKLKIDFSEGIYPLSKYTAEHLGLKQEKTSDLLTASQQPAGWRQSHGEPLPTVKAGCRTPRPHPQQDRRPEPVTATHFPAALGRVPHHWPLFSQLEGGTTNYTFQRDITVCHSQYSTLTSSSFEPAPQSVEARKCWP